MSEEPDSPDRTDQHQAGFVRPGTIIAGKYVVEEVIGEGGMGYVVSALHRQLGKRVALKFLKPELSLDQVVVMRLIHEARAAAHLQGEHIARVLDVGTHDDGAPYIVMEHLVGRDLGCVIDTPGRTPIHDAVEWILHACGGLAEAHARRVVHCDVKPENLFLVENDGWRSIKVLDFGISKAALVHGIDPTESVMGSPVYMSPEQLRNEPDVDHRADVWSLGAVLFELLTKTTPHAYTRDVTKLISSILDGEPRKLRTFRPDAPAALEEIILTCMKKDRRERYANAAELAIALLPFAPGRARVVAERAAAVTTAAGLAVRELTIPDPFVRSSSPSLVTETGAFEAVTAPPISASFHPPRNSQPTLTDVPRLVFPRSAGRMAMWIGAASVLSVLGFAAGLMGAHHPSPSSAPPPLEAHLPPPVVRAVAAPRALPEISAATLPVAASATAPTTTVLAPATTTNKIPSKPDAPPTLPPGFKDLPY